MKPNFVQMALDWLIRATGHVPIGREKSLAVELEKAFDAGAVAGTQDIRAGLEKLIADYDQMLETRHIAKDLRELLEAVPRHGEGV